jgi:hypothetical protein
MMKPTHVHGLNALHLEIASLDFNVQRDDFRSGRRGWSAMWRCMTGVSEQV